MKSLFPRLQVQKIRGKIRKNGFSLVEVLAAITIGGIIMASAMTAYGIFAQTSRQIEISEKLIRQTNFALTRIIDRTRNYRIDYQRYQSQNYDPRSAKSLYLIGSNDETFEFRFTKDHNFTMNGEPLFSSEFLVENGIFHITPTKDPFTTVFKNNQELQKNYHQPKIDISNFVVTSKQIPTLKTQIQTTISSRLYR